MKVHLRFWVPMLAILTFPSCRNDTGSTEPITPQTTISLEERLLKVIAARLGDAQIPATFNLSTIPSEKTGVLQEATVRSLEAVPSGSFILNSTNLYEYRMNNGVYTDHTAGKIVFGFFSNKNTITTTFIYYSEKGILTDKNQVFRVWRR